MIRIVTGSAMVVFLPKDICAGKAQSPGQGKAAPGSARATSRRDGSALA